MSKNKVLRVEDDEDILPLVNYNMIKSGFLVSLAESGEEVLEMRNVFSMTLVSWISI